MANEDMEWWPLSAALAWIDMRQALPWESWPDAFPRPMLGQSDWHSDRVLLPESLKQGFRKKDDGVEPALAKLCADLISALARGRVRVRGRGPWAFSPKKKRRTVAASSAAAAPRRDIAAEEFTRRGIAIFPAGSSIEPGDQPDLPEFSDHSPIDLRTFPRWLDVEVRAEDMRAVWPSGAHVSDSDHLSFQEADATMHSAPEVKLAAAPAPEIGPPSPPEKRRVLDGSVKASAKTHPRYSQQALESWFKHRLTMKWIRFPTEAEDRAAASEYFAVHISRDPFREIRRQFAPEKWRKQGLRR